MGQSNIEWTDETWNPVRGCSIVSPGCINCYAMKQAHRFSGAVLDKATSAPHQHGNDRASKLKSAPYAGLTKQTKAGPQWTGKVMLVPEKLAEPLSWRKPRRVFVNSMSDLFQEGVPDDYIDQVFAVMALAHRHTFQVLTKRPERMRAYCAALQDREVPVSLAITRTAWWDGQQSSPCAVGAIEDRIGAGPLPNVWLGVSVENQHFADERIPLLLQTPAAVRFISAEPLLEGLRLFEIAVPDDQAGKYAGHGHTFNALQREDDLTLFNSPAHLDWVIVGGESGHGARPFDIAWARSIVAQCKGAGVACFVKQLGEVPVYRTGPPFNGPQPLYSNGEKLSSKGGDMAEWPEDLRVREFPADGSGGGR